MVIAILILSILLGSFAQVFLKQGMRVIGMVTLTDFIDSPGRFLSVHWLYLGFACYGASLILWLVVLSKTELSRAYPMVSLGYMVTFVLGAVLFRESVSLPKVCGLVLIMAGVALLARG